MTQFPEARSSRWMLVWSAACLALLLGPAPLRSTCAEEEDASEADDGLMEASPDQAKKMVAALKQAARKKKLKDIAPALEAIEGFKHPDFEKPLLKLMTSASGEAALRATDLLGERANPKLLKKMWKKAFGHKANKGRLGVHARVVRAYGEQGVVLDKGKYGDVERDWRMMFGNPQERFSGPALDLIKYFELTKDKRHCRKLAEEIDEPVATSPNAGNNPPAEWWERRWKMWQPLMAAVVDALKAITGQEFDSTEQAKVWFEQNEKSFKFSW